jgi:hypothetical protein
VDGSGARPQRRGGFGAVPWGLLGCLLVVAPVERFVARDPLHLASLDAYEWGLNGKAARQPAATSSAILCLGSSMSNCGLIPPVIERVSGRSAYNLSLAFGPPATHQVLLQRALDAGARPAAILIEVHPQALTEGPWYPSRFWPELLGPREALDLAWNAGDPSLFAAIALAEASPTIRRRDAIRAAVLHALKGEANPLPLGHLMILRNKRLNRGAMLHPVVDYHGEIPEAFRQALLPPAWSPSPINTAYFERTLALAASRGIPVFWHIPPFSPPVQDERQKRFLDEAFTRFVRATQARHPGLTVLDARRSGYGVALFRDPVHLNRRGAVAYSEAVAKVIRDRLEARPDAPRDDWVALPPCRPADDPSLEDAAQSAIVLWSRPPVTPPSRRR